MAKHLLTVDETAKLIQSGGYYHAGVVLHNASEEPYTNSIFIHEARFSSFKLAKQWLVKIVIPKYDWRGLSEEKLIKSVNDIDSDVKTNIWAADRNANIFIKRVIPEIYNSYHISGDRYDGDDLPLGSNWRDVTIRKDDPEDSQSETEE